MKLSKNVDPRDKARNEFTLIFWWRRAGLNCRPPACKAGALPAELRPPKKMVGPSGFEPLTPVLSGLCSNQLSYGPEIKCKHFCCAMPWFITLNTKYQKPPHIDRRTLRSLNRLSRFLTRASVRNKITTSNFISTSKSNNWMPSLRIIN